MGLGTSREYSILLFFGRAKALVLSLFASLDKQCGGCITRRITVLIIGDVPVDLRIQHIDSSLGSSFPKLRDDVRET
jgi:hypothetical protein